MASRRQFEVGPNGATLVSHGEYVTVESLRARTGFAFEVAAQLEAPLQPSEQTLAAIRSLDPDRLRDALVGGDTPN